MSSIEEQLERDIAAATEGVIVTESDLRKARSEVEDRLESGTDPGSRRRTAWLLAATAALLVPVLGLAAVQNLTQEDSAPAAPGPGAPDGDTSASSLTPFVPRALAGIWREDNAFMHLSFTPDASTDDASRGYVTLDSGGQSLTDPDVVGSYEVAGNLISITVTDGSIDGGPECFGQDIVLRASLVAAGRVRYSLTETTAGDCWAGGDQGTLERVLPTNPDLMEYVVPVDGDWIPARPANMTGLWMAQGGGSVIEFSPDGRYVAQDSRGVRDTGRWTLSGTPATLRLTSSKATVGCPAGGRLVLTDVQHALPHEMHGTVTDDACGAAWASPTWILMPHQGTFD